MLVFLAVFLALVSVSVITDTPPFVVINGKPYWIFTKGLNLNDSIFYGSLQNKTSYDYTDENVKALKHLRWVQYLGINNYTQIKDLSFLSEMSSLKEICYNGGRGDEAINEIEDWSPLNDCKKLEDFIGFNISMPNLSAFKGTKNLKDLYIERHPNGLGSVNPEYRLTDISDVKYLVNLEVFEIFGNGIDDISALKSCTKLKTLTLYGITATDGSALLELPELERLEIDKGVLTESQVNTLREKGVDVREREITEEGQ